MGDIISSVTGSATFKTGSTAIGVIGIVIAVFVLYWIYKDARDRDYLPAVWVASALFAAIAGLFLGFSINNFGFAPVGVAAAVGAYIVMIVYKVARPIDYKDDIIERELSTKLIRAELGAKACPRCSSPIENEFLLCPECGLSLREPCNYCGKPINKSWRVCPYCKARQSV